MSKLVTLTEDGPLGKAGTRVWVNDEPAQADKPKQAPRKSAQRPKKSAK